MIRTFLIIVCVLLLGHKGYCANIKAPPVVQEIPFEEGNSERQTREEQDYIQHIYQNWNNLEVVTTDPNGNRRGNHGDIVAFDSQGTHTIRIETASPSGTVWSNVATQTVTSTITTTNSMVRVFPSGNQIVTTASEELVVLDSESYDLDGDFANNAFSAPADGYYLVIACVQWDDLAGSAEARTIIKVNGSAVTTIYGQGSSTTKGQSVNGTDVLNLSSGDDITMHVRHDTGGNETIIGTSDATYLTVTRMSRASTN